MKWMEFIHIRSLDGLTPEVIQELCCEPGAVSGEGGCVRSTVFYHYRIESDYGIVLDCDAEYSAGPPSPLGVRLVAALKVYGSVSHTIWLECSKNNKPKTEGVSNGPDNSFQGKM